jgi:hypothetical protein
MAEVRGAAFFSGRTNRGERRAEAHEARGQGIQINKKFRQTGAARFTLDAGLEAIAQE